MDYPELNVYELCSLSKLYGGGAPYKLSPRYYAFRFPGYMLPRLVSRLCGSHNAGLLLGVYAEDELAEAGKRLNRLIGKGTYMVEHHPRNFASVGLLTPFISAKVNLTSPTHRVTVAKIGGEFLVGLSTHSTARTALSANPPKTWSYFHPGVLPAYFSGLMCNLAMCPDNGRLLDPFCGAGSTLVAAATIGLEPFGIEVNRKQAYGSRRNMVELHIGYAGVILGDSSRQCFKENVFDAAVFDPPYGRVASLHGRRFEDLVRETLTWLDSSLKKGGRICFLYPRGSLSPQAVEHTGFKPLFTSEIVVHRSLTRVVAVAQKNG